MSQHLIIINNWTLQQSQIHVWETFSIFSVFYCALQTLQLHLVPFQCLIIILNDSRFSEDFIWYGKLFQILGPKTLKLLLPKVTWLCSGRLKFKLHLHFTCGFSFRHSLKLPFAAVLLISNGSNDERLSINQIKKKQL